MQIILMKFRRVFYPRQKNFPIILHPLDADMIYLHQRIFIHPWLCISGVPDFATIKHD